MKTFAEYLQEYIDRADYDETAAGALSDADVLALVQGEAFARHESPVVYEHLGDSADSDTVYRLGGKILLGDIQSHLDALVTAGSLKRLNFKNFYVCNPSLRNGR